MITEDYVSFEVAKLLKEKGFNANDCKNSPNYAYNKNGVFSGPSWDTEYSAPTLQMAMKWLREKKHYYIQIMLDSWVLGNHSGFYVVIQKTDSDFEMILADVVDTVLYETYETAANVALLYVLKELI